MNKAFVREPEDSGELHCPSCGSLGSATGRETIQALLKPEAVEQVAESAYFCPSTNCSVAYFDHLGRTVDRSFFCRPTYPKDLDAPICGCFGFTRDDVDADVNEGVVTRCRALVEKSRSPEARCAITMPDGQCCVPEVQRYFMRLRQERERELERETG